MTRLGIFGGSFDPVHSGHVKLASGIIEAGAADKLIIVPAAMSPFKSESFSAGSDRLCMCRLAFPGERFEVSDFELLKGGRSYTYDTVLYFRELYPQAELFLTVGEDQLLDFHKWRRYRDILKLASLYAVCRRGSADRETLEAYADEYIRPFGVCRIPEFEPFEISSTEIRALAAAGKDISGLVPGPVERYILENGLYKNRA